MGLLCNAMAMQHSLTTTNGRNNLIILDGLIKIDILQVAPYSILTHPHRLITKPHTNERQEMGKKNHIILDGCIKIEVL